MTFEGELQHLGFVREKALAAQDLSVGVYKTLRSYTPSTIESTAASAEEAASAWLVPFWEWASGIGDKCLKSADGVVDSVGAAYKEKFEPTKEHVSKSTTEALDFVKKEGVTGVATKASERFSTLLKDMKIDAYLEWMQSEGLTGTAKAIYEKAPEQVSEKAAEIWSEVSRNPTVNKLFEYYMSVHDSVVGSKLYGSTWDSTTELLGKLEASTAYQSYIQPYANPAVEKVKGMTVTKKVYEHIKPIPTEEAPVTNKGEELTDVAKAE